MHGICTSPAIGSQVRPEVVLHADFGGILDLLVRAVQRGDEASRGHRARDAHLALATHLGARIDALRL